jgi:hypothetical protein
VQASHHSRHIRRGLAYRESCLVCNPSYVKPAVEPPQAVPELVEKERAREELKLQNELDYARLYRLVERRRPLQEIAGLFGKSVDELKGLAEHHFKATWETLAARAPIELRNDLLDTCYRKARQGDVRFILLLEKWNLLTGEDDLKGMVTASGLPKEDLSSISTAELEERVRRVTGKYLAIVGRPSRFEENGNLSPTLTLRDAEEGEGLITEPWVPLPAEADQVPVTHEAELSTEVASDTTPEEVKPEGPPPRGDAVARPQAGVLTL